MGSDRSLKLVKRKKMMRDIGSGSKLFKEITDARDNYKRLKEDRDLIKVVKGMKIQAGLKDTRELDKLLKKWNTLLVTQEKYLNYLNTCLKKEAEK